MPDLFYESVFYESQASGIVAGVDEAGCGPWAGPVVAAAVVLDLHNIPDGINDSKKLNAIQREALFHCIMPSAHTGIGIVSVEEIDALNILRAAQLAMCRALAALPIAPALALIDGNRAPDVECDVQLVIQGDVHSLSIAAASIIAKVTRDRLMRKLAQDYPAYGWEHNAGYGTRKHQDALATHGITPHHRRSFKPIRAYADALLEVA